jgi:hypothetical protein
MVNYILVLAVRAEAGNMLEPQQFQVGALGLAVGLQRGSHVGAGQASGRL